MRRTRSVAIIAIVIGLVVVAAALVILTRAPETSSVIIATSPTSCAQPLANGDCAQLPSVTGTNLNNDEVAFPAGFAGDYNLVVMPFDRDQQSAAIEYVPLFQTLAEENAGVAYYSIAALPDLAAPVRLLVSGGMNALIDDAALRPLIALLYLDDQDAFIAALGVENTEQIRVFIFNQDGQVLWQGSGAYSAANAEALQAALLELVAAE